MTRPVRILAIHRYFWPDTPPYATLLLVIARHWVDQGHRVEVLASQPSYKSETALQRMPAREWLEGLEVRRLPMTPDAGPHGRKLRNMVRFSALAFLQVLFGPRRDVVMCSTAPQVLLGWATSLAARLRRSQFVYHCMDLHPEIGRMSGEFSNPMVYRVLMRMDLAACRRAAAIVVLSDDMRDALVDRDKSLTSRIHMINNFDIPSDGHGSIVEPDGVADENRLVLCFTGNLGRFQGLETLVDAVLGDDPQLDQVRLVLMGEGAVKPAIQAQLGAASDTRARRVVLLPHGTPAQARAVMRASDLALVTLTRGVIRFAYPSKTATYLSEGLPILAGVEPDSALARDIERWQVGDTLSLDDVDVLRRQLLGWVDRRAELPALSRRATAAWRENFAAEMRLTQWDGLLQTILANRTAVSVTG